LGESLGDGGEALGVGRTVRAGQSFSFGLVTNKMISIRELSTEHLSNKGDREVENKIVQIRSSGGYLGSLSDISLLRRLLAEFQG